MFTIDQDSSCVSFGISKRHGKEKIINSISKSTGLIPFVEVVIVEDVLNNEIAYENAKLYVELYSMPEEGVPLFCDICSSSIHKIIENWAIFLEKLAFQLECEIYIDFLLGKVYAIGSSGIIQQKEYSTEFINEMECIFIKD